MLLLLNCLFFPFFAYFPAHFKVFNSASDMTEVENRRSDVNNENEKCMRKNANKSFYHRLLSLSSPFFFSFRYHFFCFFRLSFIFGKAFFYFLLMLKPLQAEAINRQIQCYRHFCWKIQTITIPFLNVVYSFVWLFFVFHSCCCCFLFVRYSFRFFFF